MIGVLLAGGIQVASSPSFIYQYRISSSPSNAYIPISLGKYPVSISSLLNSTVNFKLFSICFFSNISTSCFIAFILVNVLGSSSSDIFPSPIFTLTNFIPSPVAWHFAKYSLPLFVIPSNISYNLLYFIWC